jgi:hypothetical protein
MRQYSLYICTEIDEVETKVKQHMPEVLVSVCSGYPRPDPRKIQNHN